MKQVFVIGLGGFLGTIARYGAVNFWAAAGWPVSSLYLINGLGSFLIGCLFAASLNREAALFSFLTVGVLGGFTTFSSFSMETVLYFKDGRWFYGICYAIAMTVLCVLSAATGYFLAESLKFG